MHGQVFDQHMILNLWVALGLLALAHCILLAALFAKGRKTSKAAGLWAVEVLPLAGLTLLFAWLSVTAERLWAAQRYVGADAAAMQVEVVGAQFQWYFRYPGIDASFGKTTSELIDAPAGNPLGRDLSDPAGQDDFVSSELVLPVGREVDLRIRSLDVIHGFFVPEMRIKQNALPGQMLHIHFTPTQTGDYAIMCSQLCGLGHYRMQAELRVVSAAEFEQWEAEHERR